MQGKPKLKSYLSVHRYLQDLYVHRKALDPDFSYDSWSYELGVKSRSYLRMVVVGKRKLTEKFSEIFCAKMGFEPAETDYFKLVTAYSQLGSHEQRKLLLRKLIELSHADLDRVSVEQHHEFFSSPFLPKLQTLLTFEDIETSSKSLASILELPLAQVEAGLKKLRDMGLAEPSGLNWRAKNKLLKVPDRFGDSALANFHSESLREASAAQKLPADLRRFRSLLIPLNPAEFAELQAEFEEFVKHTLAKYKADELKGRRLYQMNFNMYPISLETIPELKDEHGKPPAN